MKQTFLPVSVELIEGTFPDRIFEDNTGTVTPGDLNTLITTGEVTTACGKYKFTLELLSQREIFNVYVDGNYFNTIRYPEALSEDKLYAVVSYGIHNGEAKFHSLETVDSEGTYRHASSTITLMERASERYEEDDNTFEKVFKEASFTYRYLREQKVTESEANKFTAQLLAEGIKVIESNNKIKLKKLTLNSLLDVLAGLYGETRVMNIKHVPEEFDNGAVYETALSGSDHIYEHNFFVKDLNGNYYKTGALSLILDMEKYSEEIIKEEEKEEVRNEDLTEAFTKFF